MVDDVQVGYCDNIVKRAVPKHDWIKKIKETDQQQVEWHDLACSTSQYHFKPFSEILKQQLNQTEGNVCNMIPTYLLYIECRICVCYICAFSHMVTKIVNFQERFPS